MQLVGLPPGSLVHKACGKYVNWYRQLHHELTYLTKDQLPLKKQLAYKKYVTTAISEYQQELIALSAYLKRHKSSLKSSDMLSKDSCYFPLIHSKFETKLSLSAEILAWCNSTYQRNPLHP